MLKFVSLCSIFSLFLKPIFLLFYADSINSCNHSSLQIQFSSSVTHLSIELSMSLWAVSFVWKWFCFFFFASLWGFPGDSYSKESACNAGDPGSIPGSGRSPGEGNGNPLQYSCLENAMHRGAWQILVHGVAKSLSDTTERLTFHFIGMAIWLGIKLEIAPHFLSGLKFLVSFCWKVNFFVWLIFLCGNLFFPLCFKNICCGCLFVFVLFF